MTAQYEQRVIPIVRNIRLLVDHDEAGRKLRIRCEHLCCPKGALLPQRCLWKRLFDWQTGQAAALALCLSSSLVICELMSILREVTHSDVGEERSRE